MLETEFRKLAFHKHEISLAFISMLHLTLNTHPDSVLYFILEDVGFLVGGLEVGRGKLQTDTKFGRGCWETQGPTSQNPDGKSWQPRSTIDRIIQSSDAHKQTPSSLGPCFLLHSSGSFVPCLAVGFNLGEPQEPWVD